MIPRPKTTPVNIYRSIFYILDIPLAPAEMKNKVNIGLTMNKYFLFTYKTTIIMEKHVHTQA